MLLMAVLSTGCTSDPRQSRIRDSPVVPFGELFAPADTVRLDPSILIGQIGFLDVNQEGDLLVTDRIGQSVHLFSSSGEHLRTYSVPICLPDLEDFYPVSSRFIGKGQVLTMQPGGAAVVFSADGSCVDADRRWPEPSFNFCANGDSIFILRPPLRKDSDPAVAVYTSDLHKLREITLERSKLPVLNSGVHSGILGRGMDCFGDGPYFTYLESMDAIPAYVKTGLTQQRPEFFLNGHRTYCEGSP